jgi:hypothetical protein
LKASVLMALYSVRSERAFCERLNYDLLFKWFLDMRIDEAASRRVAQTWAGAWSQNRSELSVSTMVVASAGPMARCERGRGSGGPCSGARRRR